MDAKETRRLLGHVQDARRYLHGMCFGPACHSDLTDPRDVCRVCKTKVSLDYAIREMQKNIEREE